MIKLGCGGFMLLMGASIVIWVAYNLLVAKQQDFAVSGCAILFLLGLFYVGSKWVFEGWQVVGPKFRGDDRPRKKRKRKQPREEAKRPVRERSATIVKCPKCKRRYDPGVDEELEDLEEMGGDVSLKVVCPACGQWLRLPEREAIPAPKVSPEMLEEMKAQSRLIDDDDEDEDDEPRPRKRKRP